MAGPGEAPCVCHPATSGGYPFNPFVAQYFSDCVYTPREIASFAVGLSSLGFWIFCQAPQFVKNCRSGSADALSIFFLLEWFLGDGLNLVGALMTHQLKTEIMTAVLFVCMDVCITGQWIYLHVKNRNKKRAGYEAVRGGEGDCEDGRSGGAASGGDDGGGGGGSGGSGGSGDEFLQPNRHQHGKESKLLSAFGIALLFYGGGRMLLPASSAAMAGGDDGSSSGRWGSVLGGPMEGGGGSPPPNSMSGSMPSAADGLFMHHGPAGRRHLLSASAAEDHSGGMSALGGGDPYLKSLKSSAGGGAFMAPAPAPHGPRVCNAKVVQDSWTHELGVILGWVSAAVYLTSRLPQIAKNCKRRSVEGLSVMMFTCAVLGNLTYSLGIFLRSTEPDKLREAAPWLLGSVGTLAMDFFILMQVRRCGGEATRGYGGVLYVWERGG